jgi:aconitate hydratase
MGVLPLQFRAGESAASLGLTGTESFDLSGTGAELEPGGDVAIKATSADGAVTEFVVTCRVDTPDEMTSYRHGGILPFVLRRLAKA